MNKLNQWQMEVDSRNDRIKVVEGESGTGKTYYCMHKAKEWMDEGNKVLFISGEQASNILLQTMRDHLSLWGQTTEFKSVQMKAWCPHSNGYINFVGKEDLSPFRLIGTTYDRVIIDDADKTGSTMVPYALGMTGAKSYLLTCEDSPRKRSDGRYDISWDAALVRVEERVPDILNYSISNLKRNECQSCEGLYGEDLIVPDEWREKIKPEGSEEGAGLLCPSCITKRLVRNGWSAVHVSSPDPDYYDTFEEKAAALYDVVMGNIEKFTHPRELNNYNYNFVSKLVESIVEYAMMTSEYADDTDLTLNPSHWRPLEVESQ